MQLESQSRLFVFQSTAHTPDEVTVFLAPLAAVLAQAQARPAAPAQQFQPDPVAQLKHLAELRDSGVLSDHEFQAAKAKLVEKLT